VKTLRAIRNQLQNGDFEFSRHAFKRAVERNISERELRELGKNAEIIESYPDDKYTPSCLLLGFTANGRALHIQVSLAEGETLKIVTLYEPSSNEWLDDAQRRP
jgi:hypothetical protein